MGQLALVVVLLILHTDVMKASTSSSDVFPLDLQLFPSRVEDLYELNAAELTFNYTATQVAWKPIYVRFSVDLNEPKVAYIQGRDTFPLSLEDTTTSAGNESVVYVYGEFLGRTFLNAHWIYQDEMTNEIHATAVNWRPTNIAVFPITVIRKHRVLDDVFLAAVLILVTFANVGMGCKVDLKVVKEVLKKPIPPLIGFCCQYLIMPPLAFGIAKLLKIHGGLGLGFFAAGCAPGGGASNMYSYLLGGDVSLSITMTLISTCAALGMLPLWLFTLGRFFVVEGSNMQIPYGNIFGTLFGSLAPIAIGIVIQHKRPLWAKKIGRLLRPFLFLFLIFMFTFGVYVNVYIFKLFTWKLMLAGMLLPYISFILGGFVAWLLRQTMSRVITIAIETGIQNPGIPILTLRSSLPPPDGDLSIASPIVVSTFTPIPLLFAVVVVEIRKRVFGIDCKQKAEATESDSDDELAKKKELDSEFEAIDNVEPVKPLDPTEMEKKQRNIV